MFTQLRKFLSARRYAAALAAALLLPAALFASPPGSVSPMKKGKPSADGDGVVRVPVLLVAFRDLGFTYTRDEISDVLNLEGYSRDGATGCAADYFRDQFGGKYEFRFEVSDIVTLSYGYSFYGRNENLDAPGTDLRMGRMVYEACMLADSKVDFSSFDSNGDGVLDQVMVIFAGEDEAAGADADHLWSKSGFLDTEKNLDLECDGIRINCYACTSEIKSDRENGNGIMTIGTFCHEYCHTLGLPDFYDINGLSAALWGSTSIMDRGNLNNGGRTPPNFNAIERRILGISSMDTLKAGDYRLEPVDKSGVYLYAGTETEGEFYLFECREASGWDKYIGGSGMLIYHVDSSYNSVSGAKACDRWLMKGPYANTVNSHSDHQCADLVEADPSAVFPGVSSSGGDFQRIFYPSGENDSFTPASDPAFSSWSGEASGISVTDIRYESGAVCFSVYDNEYSLLPVVSDVSIRAFQDAAIVTWSADTWSSAYVILSDGSSTIEELDAEPYEEGRFSVTFEGLSPSSTYTVSIGYSVGGITGPVTIRQISTHPSTDYPPYIYLHDMARNADGSFPSGTGFPLRLYNAADAESVEWTMDGTPVETDGSGYYVPQQSGVLEAVARFPDGREFRVSKYIGIK